MRTVSFREGKFPWTLWNGYFGGEKLPLHKPENIYSLYRWYGFLHLGTNEMLGDQTYVPKLIIFIPRIYPPNSGCQWQMKGKEGIPIKKSTLPETNSSSLKIGLPKRKVIFQPTIFRGYVSFGRVIVLVVTGMGDRSNVYCGNKWKVNNIVEPIKYHNIWPWGHVPKPGEKHFMATLRSPAKS